MRWLWVFALAKCGSSAPTTISSATAEPPTVCERGEERVRLEPVGDGSFVASDHGDYGGGPGTERWHADLDGDGVVDRSVFFWGCGNYGECIVGVYVGCGDDEYVAVLAPDYHWQLDVADTTTVVDGVSWRDLTLTERSETAVYPSVRLTFDGTRYR